MAGTRFRSRTGVTAEFETNREEVEIAPDRAAALYRVAQEALANVTKYAHAQRVSVQLFAAQDEVSLEVATTASASTHAPDGHPGFGVRGLLERARGFGGWAEVNSAPGRGTTVMFSIPPGSVPTAPATPVQREKEWTDAG